MMRDDPAGAPRRPWAGWSRVIWLLSGGLATFVFVLGCLMVWEALAGPPVFALGPRVDINTPDPAPPRRAARRDGILPVTPPALALARGAQFASRPAPRRVAAAQNATATAAARQMGQPTLEIGPEAGPPGTQITLIGQGWPAYDAIVLRLQDPHNAQAMLAEYPLAITDSGGGFRTTFTIPTNPPWGLLPAVLLWTASPKTGVQIRAPEPFVITSGPVAQQVTTPTPIGTVSGTATATPASTAGTATASPTPTGLSTFQSPGVTPTPAPFVLATPLPTMTPFTNTTSSFQSPLPTPASLPPRQASPRLLPPSGATILATAGVTAPQVTLRSQPGNGYPALATAGQGSALGVLGQNVASDWLQVTTGHGVTGWVPRSATDFRGN